jgi:peptidase E
MKTQIVTLGGGGFSGDRNNLLDDFILSLANSRRPQICFLPTASADNIEYVKRFYYYFPEYRAIPTHLLINETSSVKEIARVLLGQEIIYVGGGNTIYLLKVWKKFGVDKILMEAYQRGIVLAGMSAGMNCWFEEFATDSMIEGSIVPFKKGLGFIKGSACPHYNNESYRRAYNYYIQEGFLKEGTGADEGVGLYYLNGKLTKAVSSNYLGRAYKVTAKYEKPYRTDFLGLKYAM